MKPEDLAVLELSSFQLMTLSQSPDIAVFTNLSPNHLDIHKSMEEYAQIRALTKGDITKEKEILSLDTWRALTELNAQAKEYKQINAQINAKK